MCFHPKRRQDEIGGDSMPFDLVIILADENSFLEKRCVCNTREGRGAWNCTVLVLFQCKKVEGS
jgi:hypothetical protein